VAQVNDDSARVSLPMDSWRYQKRFFILSDSQRALYYFKSPDDVPKTNGLRGQINMAECMVEDLDDRGLPRAWTARSPAGAQHAGHVVCEGDTSGTGSAGSPGYGSDACRGRCWCRSRLCVGGCACQQPSSPAAQVSTAAWCTDVPPSAVLPQTWGATTSCCCASATRTPGAAS
jgi:hypothetical protein